MADRTLSCIDCGCDFLFSVGEQEWYRSKGYTTGKTRCAECTAAKKARFGETAGKGHTARDLLAKTMCRVCGELGHKSNACPKAPCYNCGKPGHLSKDCTVPRNNQAGGGVCFKFQSGTCTRGAACRFAHVLEGATS